MGLGRERMGHCIAADSGNSVGEISGHSAQINSVSIRPLRPLRAATGSDDTSTVFYHGTPFKFNTSLRGQHDRFVLGTEFSPDGSLLVTVGADKRIWLYDGKTGEAKQNVGEGTHTGSILGLSWAGDSKQFATASTDQTVRVWDADTAKLVQSWHLGKDGKSAVQHQQVGVVWPKNRSDSLIISADLDGNLNYLNLNSPKPSRVVQSHQKSITAATTTQNKTLWTGSSEGRVLAWDITQGFAGSIHGEQHKNYIASLSTSAQSQSKVYSVAWDDSLRQIDQESNAFANNTTKLSGQPKALTVTASSIVVVSTPSGLETFSDTGEAIGSHKTTFTPTSLAVCGSLIAVGGDDKVLRLYDLSEPKDLKLIKELRDATSPISTLSFASKGNLLAVGVATGKIYVYECSDSSSVSADWKLYTSRWSAHTARVTCVAWRDDGAVAASGSLDTNVHVWSVSDPGKRIVARNAHKEGVSAVVWAKNRILSTGADASVKVWKVQGI